MGNAKSGPETLAQAAELLERQQAGIEALRKWAAAEPGLRAARQSIAEAEGPGILAPDRFYERFLIARGWAPEPAKKMLASHIQWRACILPSTLTSKSLAEAALQFGPFTFLGHDREGCPVMLSHHRRFEPSRFTVQSYTQYMVFMLEECIRAMKDGGPDQISLVFDLDGFEYSKHSGPGVLGLGKAMIEVAQDEYPERLRRILAVNTPRLFRGIWHMVTPFLDAKTLEKIQFHSGVDVLPKYVSAEILPPRLRHAEVKHSRHGLQRQRSASSPMLVSRGPPGRSGDPDSAQVGKPHETVPPAPPS